MDVWLLWHEAQALRHCQLDDFYADYFSEFDLILLTKNLGQDIGAYKVGIQNLSDRIQNRKVPCVLMNTSVRLKDTERLLRLSEVSAAQGILTGIGMGFGPRNSIQKHFHLQSYFLCARFSDFVKIFDDISVPYAAKLNIIKYGEVAISRIALKKRIPLVCEVNGEIFITETEITRLRSADSRYFVDCSAINTL